MKVPIRKGSACNKLAQAWKEHDFGLKKLEISVYVETSLVILHT